MPTRTLLTGLLGAALLIPVPTAAGGGLGVANGGRSVDDHGLHLTVPGHWRVIDLDRTPHACVRPDLPTRYLGHAGTQARCAGRDV